jgi:hypothetical protein
MFVKLGILFITGILTMIIGVKMIVEANNNVAFNKLVPNQDSGPGLYYYRKADALYINGSLVIIYGIVITGISGYWILAEKFGVSEKTINIVIGIIAAIGVISSVVAMTVKNAHVTRPATK